MCVVWDSEQGGLDPGQLALALLLTFFVVEILGFNIEKDVFQNS